MDLREQVLHVIRTLRHRALWLLFYKLRLFNNSCHIKDRSSNDIGETTIVSQQLADLSQNSDACKAVLQLAVGLAQVWLAAATQQTYHASCINSRGQSIVLGALLRRRNAQLFQQQQRHSPTQQVGTVRPLFVVHYIIICSMQTLLALK